jgi:diguanylate cyclase (GGDEF)-like protein
MAPMEAQPLPERGLEKANRLINDLVTGLPNEHLFHLSLPDEFVRAREAETNGALLAIKLDNIIAINSVHGREGGDEALRAVAQILSSYRAGAPERSSSLAFKLSGPVFGYFIPSCSAPAARQAAEYLLSVASQSELFLERLTISVGLVNMYEFFMEEGTQQQLALRIEQTALYRMGIAESQGRNTVCDASDTSEAATSAHPTILVVEPDPLSIELLIQALESAGFVVHSREDGESAVAFIQATPPSLVICEAMTPRLNGFDIRQRLRASSLWNAIPFILVSHKKNEDLIRKAVENDIRYFFRKPLSIAEVVGLAGNLLKGGER